MQSPLDRHGFPLFGATPGRVGRASAPLRGAPATAGARTPTAHTTAPSGGGNGALLPAGGRHLDGTRTL